MLFSDIQKYAQGLLDSGLDVDEIKTLVKSKVGTEDVLDADGNTVSLKTLKLEEKAVEEIDIDVEVKKAVEKEVKNTPAPKVYQPKVEHVKRPTQHFEDVESAHNFAKAFVPKNVMENFNNHKALSTYQNIGTDADGGSFDVVDAQGLLADSVTRRNSYVEDTLQVKLFGSVGTFIDHTSDATAYMIDESSAGTESKPGNTTRTITQKKIMTLCPVTNEVFRFGSLVDIADATLDSMARAISTKKQHLIFTADATADTNDGGILGLIPAMNAVASNTSEYIVGGDWSTIDNTDISRIVALVAGWANPGNYSWYAHKNNWGYLEGIARSLGGNSYVVQTGTLPRAFLFGYEVKFVEAMPSSFSEDETGLLFGDLAGAIATGSDEKTYVDASPDFYFSQDVTVLRAIQHMGVTVYQPGTNGTSTSVVAVNYSENS